MTRVPETAPQDAVLRYSNVTVAFHWTTVFLVLLQAYLGFRFGLSEPSPSRDEVFLWHKSVGILILVLMLAPWPTASTIRRLRSRPSFPHGSASRPSGTIGYSTPC